MMKMMVQLEKLLPLEVVGREEVTFVKRESYNY
jgi:hypothetical protein